MCATCVPDAQVQKTVSRASGTGGVDGCEPTVGAEIEPGSSTRASHALRPGASSPAPNMSSMTKPYLLPPASFLQETNFSRLS